MKTHRALRSLGAERAPAGRLGRLATKFSGKNLLGALRGLVADARSSARQAALERLPNVTAVGRSLVDRVLPEPYSSPRQVINATGVLMPDGLEPALPLVSLERIREQASVAATSSECLTPPDHRPEAALHLAAHMAGAEAAVLHNPAGALAAVFAALAGEGAAGLAGEGKVVVARRDMGIICRRHGLSIADVAASADARLREVGSVDRLSVDDYSRPASEKVRLLLRVEGADYEIFGAGEPPSREELAVIARRAGIPLVVFLPTAALCPTAGLDASIPQVGQVIASGADLAVFCGQRYLGGPACGIIVGRRHWIEAIAASPLTKLLAADRLTLAALEATLLLARDGAAGERGIPLWQMLGASLDVLKNRAHRLAPQIADCSRVAGVEIAAGFAHVGPAKLARERVDDWRILIEPAGGAAQELADALRAGTPGVWSTTVGGRLCLSMRSVLARDDERLVTAFAQLGTRRAKGPGATDGRAKSATVAGKSLGETAPAARSAGKTEELEAISPEEAKSLAAQAERFSEE